MLGRVATSMQILTYGTPVLGSLLAGGLASWLGPRSALWILLGIDVLAVGLLLNPSFTRRRDLPEREPLAVRNVTAQLRTTD
jgi:MFS family permease